MLLDDLISAKVENQYRFNPLYDFFLPTGVVRFKSLYDCLMYVGDDFIWPSNKKVKKKGKKKGETKGLRSILLLHFLYKNHDTFL